MSATMTPQERKAVEQNRLLWLEKARSLCAEVMAIAYRLEDRLSRKHLMHDSLEQVFEDDGLSQLGEVRALERHLMRPTYGYARYFIVKRERLIDMPDLLDILRDHDAEAML